MAIDWSDLFGKIGGYFSDNTATLGALGLGSGGLALALKGYEDIGGIGQKGYEALSGVRDEQGNLVTPGLAQELSGMLQFQPYTVTSATGGQFGMTQDPTTGQFTYNMALSPEEQKLATDLQTGAQGLIPQATTRTTAFDPLQAAALSQASTALTGAGQQDLAMALQRAGVGNLFSQQLGQIGQPTGLEGLTSAALTEGQQRIAGAGPNQQLMGLSGQFAGQVAGQLGQQPSAAVGNLAQQALGLGAQGLGAGAPQDIEQLRQQYAGLAGEAAAGMMQPRGDREQEIYQRIRATQTPEEERQRLAQEQRLASQGRLGVRTAQFGGTPEQFALAKAQAEAQNQAALSAIQQAGTEQQQAYQQAMGLAGQTGQLAGASSQLQSAAQQRAAQLSQLGLSAEQIQSALQSQGLGRAAQSAGLAGELAQASSGLESQALQRGMGLSQLGLAGTQAGAGLEAQRLQQLLGLQGADISSAQAQQALQQGQLGMASGLFDISRTAAGLPSQLQAADLANLQSMMAAGYVPQAQLLNALQPGMTAAERQRQAQAQQAQTYGQTYASGLEALLQAGLGQANLAGGFGSNIATAALGGLLTGS